MNSEEIVQVTKTLFLKEDKISTQETTECFVNTKAKSSLTKRSCGCN